LLLAQRQEQLAKEIGDALPLLRGALLKLFNELLDLWSVAEGKPEIFAPFSFPPTTVPNEIAVHNWTYASLVFATSVKRTEQMLVAVESAKQQPALADAISRAQIVRSLQNKEPISVDTIGSESRESFYAALGMRLAALREMPREAGEICKALLVQCFRQGPREVDAAVLLAATSLNLETFVRQQDVTDYITRAGNDDRCRLAVLPILEKIRLADDVEQA
jgi:hypothetical protein